jgi:hypothetical protein
MTSVYHLHPGLAKQDAVGLPETLQKYESGKIIHVGLINTLNPLERPGCNPRAPSAQLQADRCQLR